jgi:TatD DNase family protein
MDTTYPHLIDSHFHLRAIERKGIDLSSLLDAMEQEGVHGIDVGLECDDLGERIERFGRWENIRFAAGIGPWGVAAEQGPIEEQVERLVGQLDGGGAVAIGEIGLDNHWQYGSPSLQERLLLIQMDLAEERNLPVIIHNREADNQFITILQQRSFSRRGIFHCYQDGEELARLAVEKGFFISFAGPLTYKANGRMQELFAALPLSSLLLETDSPYLSPVPLRGRTNTPRSMIHIYRQAAHLRAMELSDLAQAIWENYHSFLAGN